MARRMNYNHHEKNHYVYRIFDKTGRLIYVGCSYNPEVRINTHRTQMWWGDQIHRIKLTVHPNKRAGHHAEKLAIHSEHPRWNVSGRWAHRASWTSEDFADYIKAAAGAPEPSGFRWERIEQSKQLMALRIAEEQAQSAA